MHRRHGSAASIVAFLATAIAGAASAELWVFEGQPELRGFGGPVAVATAVGVATVNGSGGGAHLSTLALPGGIFHVTTSVVPTFTTAVTNVLVNFTPGAGTFARSTPAAPLAGVLPVPGNIRLCLLLSCGFFLDVPLTENGTRGVGLGGPPIARTLLGSITFSITGDDWTGATATILTTFGPFTSAGFAHGPASATSNTVQPDGVVRLVTPAPIAVSGGVSAIVPIFGALTLRFLPEPGSFVMLASGAAAIASLGWRRRR